MYNDCCGLDLNVTQGPAVKGLVSSMTPLEMVVEPFRGGAFIIGVVIGVIIGVMAWKGPGAPSLLSGALPGASATMCGSDRPARPWAGVSRPRVNINLLYKLISLGILLQWQQADSHNGHRGHDVHSEATADLRDTWPPHDL